MVGVRKLLYGAALIALVTIVSPDAARNALAAAASTLFEATPFLFAGALLSLILGRRCRLAVYLGCGCGRGPSALSIPAAAATWLVFGPAVAIARYAAAMFVAHLLRRSAEHDRPPEHKAFGALGELAALVPTAAIAGVAVQVGGALDLHRLSPAAAALVGAVLGFAAAPCGLAAVALGGALEVRAPVAAGTFLCIAGIVDVRALAGRSRPGSNDALAYLLLAPACAIVATRGGGALVHPAFTAALGLCACVAWIGAALYRHSRCPSARYAPALMLIGVLAGAPAPQYYATETTLADLFTGEHVTFTGALVRHGGASAVVRYAITCCRADAAPVALRLDRAPPYRAGTWLRVDGRIQNAGSGFDLVARSVTPVAPPADPFVYR